MAFNGPGTRVVQLIDLTDTRSNPDGTLTRNHNVVDRGEMCYFASPYDMPCYVRFWRRLVDRSKGKSHSMEHLGTTMEIDAYTWGVKVYVKFDRGQSKGDRGKLHVIIEDHEGRETVASYE